MKKILHLPIKNCWLRRIIAGTKKVEYRVVKDYWTRRLFKAGKKVVFDEIHLRGGYGNDKPLVVCKFNGFYLIQIFNIDKFYKWYAIDVSEIIRTENLQ